MKPFGAQAIVLVFVVLVVGCAFDDVATQGQPTVPLQEEGSMCTVLGTSTVGTVFSSRPAPRTPSAEILLSRLDTYPRWLLAQSIDHPPERLG